MARFSPASQRRLPAGERRQELHRHSLRRARDDKVLQCWVGNELLRMVARKTTGEIRKKEVNGNAYPR